MAGWWITTAGRYREVFQSICDLTQEHYYKEDERLRTWVHRCRVHAAQLPISASLDELMEQVQDLMSTMNVSHFQVYTPVEDKKLWQGESIDTGIRAQFVEDHLMVMRVFSGSAAEVAGVKAGDEIVEIEGVSHPSPWGAQNRSGRFRFLRGQEVLTLDIKPGTLTIDSSPQLSELRPGVGKLSISSFRSGYFEREDWLTLTKQLSAYSHLIIDLRENAGGNFVAMLRALSTFTCGDRLAGVLVKPRKEGEEKPFFEDNTDDLYQINELDKYQSISLRTFKDYGCYRGRVTVLIGPDTSSVAEIFAQNFFYRKNSRVWGQPTAGDVVLAVWYDLPALGNGFSVSIPEAVYLTPENKELEGQGVYPQRELFQDLASARLGRDSWIDAALR